MAISIEGEEGTPQATSQATNAIPPDPHDPLNQKRMERDYSKSEGDFHGSVPEPEGFGGGIPNPEDDGNFMGGEPNSHNDEGMGGGMGLGDMPPNEKNQAANNMAEWAINLYCTAVPEGFRMIARPNEKKLTEAAMKGEINFNMPIKMPTGERMTIAQKFQSVKESVDNGFVVSEKWQEEIKPVLVRVLKKRQFGMTDENLLLSMIAEDLLVKGFAVYQIASELKGFTNWCKEETARQQQGGGYNQPPPDPFEAPQPTEPPIQPAAPAREEDIPFTPVEEITDEDHF